MVLSQCKISNSDIFNFVVSLNEERPFSGKNECIQKLKRDLCHWIQIEPKELVSVWGREGSNRSVVVDLNASVRPPRRSPERVPISVTFIGF